MSKRKCNYLNEYSENNFNCIFGLFEMAGSVASSAINKSAQNETNELNYKQFLEEMAYKNKRDSISDNRYNEELAYNRAFAEEDRDYNRAFAEENRDYNRAFTQEEQAYQRQLQQQLFEREDTAIERQASQLSELGINPVSQQLNGLGSGSVVSQSQAPQNVPSPSSTTPSQPSHNVSDIPPSFRAQAFTNFALQGLEPSLDFFNALEGIKTNKQQRDLIREEVNKQKIDNISQQLRNMDFARENGIIMNPDGTLTFKDKDYNDKVAFKKEEFKSAQADARSKTAKARIDENEAYFSDNYGPHNKVSDSAWMIEKTATRMKNTLENEIENGSDDDSSSTTLEDRLNQVADKNLSSAFAPFVQSRETDYKQNRWNKIKNFFNKNQNKKSAVFGRLR